MEQFAGSRRGKLRNQGSTMGQTSMMRNDHGCLFHTYPDDPRPAHSPVRRFEFLTAAQLMARYGVSHMWLVRRMAKDGFPKPNYFRPAAILAPHRYRAVGTLEGGDVVTRLAADKTDRTSGRAMVHKDFGRTLELPERPPNGQCDCCNKVGKLYPDFDCDPNEPEHLLSQHHRGWVCNQCRSMLQWIRQVGFEKLCRYVNRCLPLGDPSSAYPDDGRCQVCDCHSEEDSISITTTGWRALDIPSSVSSRVGLSTLQFQHACSRGQDPV